MKLYIDMIAFYLQKAGGITNVWKELIIRMLRDKKSIVLILQNCECHNIYFQQIMSYHPKVLYEKGQLIKKNRYCNVKCQIDNNSIFISTYYRVLRNETVQQYTLIHDFTYEYYVKGLKKWIHSWQKKRSVKYADTIVCVSNNTMNDLFKFYPWAKSKKCIVIYNGVSEVYKKLTGTVYIKELEMFNDKKFLVYVGSRAAYKRFDFAIEVAWFYGYGLVIVGGGDINKKEKNMLNKKLPENYLHLCGVSEEGLNEIYNKAVALVYPSEYEGFGIPILEAQKAECIVIAKKGSSINEVFGNDQYLLRSNDVKEVSKVFKDFKDDKLNTFIKKEGLKNSMHYNWEKSYEKYLKLFNKVSNNQFFY